MYASKKLKNKMFSFKKIIAFDLDGTLSVSKSQMTKDMALLVLRLMEQKTVVVISGGMFDQFKNQFLSEFEKINPPSYLLKNVILLPTSGSQRYEYDETQKK